MSNTTFSSYRSADCYFDHASFQGVMSFPIHQHDICEIIFLKKGDMSYCLDGRVYPLSRNCLVLSRPGESHSIQSNGVTEYERYNILFNKRKLNSDIFDRIPQDLSVIHFDGNALVSDLFRKFDYYCRHFEGEILQNILLHLVEEALYNIALASEETNLNGTCTVNPLINSAVIYIKEHITEPITIDSVCDNLHITKSYLHQLFLKHMKVSPKQYIISKKLISAQREIRAGKKPTEVALTYGFRNYSTFYRDYTNYFKYTPSEEGKKTVVQKILS